MSVLAAWAYFCPVLFLGSRLAGRTIGLALTGIIFAAGCGLITVVFRARLLQRIVSPARMADLGVATLSVVVILFVGDTVFTAFENVRLAKAANQLAPEVRRSDPHILQGELFPRMFFPTEENFHLYKPNVRLTADTYGGFYTPEMLESPTLADSVLELRSVSYFIGPYGLRETEPLGESRIFALGDSFVFGYATGEGSVWTDVLGERLGEPVFNLGVSATSPRSQLSMLEYLLDVHRDSMRIGHLLWMVFEGNDLEDSYEKLRPDSTAAGVGSNRLLNNTVVQALVSIPGMIRNQSVLRKLMDRQLRFRPQLARAGQDIDGVTVYSTRLFHSDRLGYKLYRRFEIERPTQGLRYVLDHPNRPLLDATFREMKALSEEHGFAVTVIVAPSSSRVHGPFFDGFPELSEKPHFINYLVQLSESVGFPVVNLLPGLEPYAGTEMLYYRDDHHWNVRGNAIVAELIDSAVFGSRGKHASGMEKGAAPTRSSSKGIGGVRF